MIRRHTRRLEIDNDDRICVSVMALNHCDTLRFSTLASVGFHSALKHT
jgi:hypothetical protein